jgi:hypothetical protein
MEASAQSFWKVDGPEFFQSDRPVSDATNGVVDGIDTGARHDPEHALNFNSANIIKLRGIVNSRARKKVESIDICLREAQNPSVAQTVSCYEYYALSRHLPLYRTHVDCGR